MPTTATVVPFSSLHPYPLCLYYGSYYYSCMASRRPRFSPSPEQGSGHHWHPARLPNQSPLRGRVEGGRLEEERGGIRKRVWNSEERQERAAGGGWRMVRGVLLVKKMCEELKQARQWWMSKFCLNKKKGRNEKGLFEGSMWISNDESQHLAQKVSRA